MICKNFLLPLKASLLVIGYIFIQNKALFTIFISVKPPPHENIHSSKEVPNNFYFPIWFYELESESQILCTPQHEI